MSLVVSTILAYAFLAVSSLGQHFSIIEKNDTIAVRQIEQLRLSCTGNEEWSYCRYVILVSYVQSKCIIKVLDLDHTRTPQGQESGDNRQAASFLNYFCTRTGIEEIGKYSAIPSKCTAFYYRAGQTDFVSPVGYTVNLLPLSVDSEEVPIF